jgi:hypothetical protein
MSAFYTHTDIIDVTALRIRTPKFETHDDAALHYYRKRMEVQASKERWRMIYSGLTLLALSVGVYKWHTGLHLTMGPRVLEFFLAATTSFGCCMIAVILCSRAFDWLWGWDDAPENEKEDDAATHSAV